MPPRLFELVSPVVAFRLVLALSPAARGLARRWGAVARPKADRWHRTPTVMLGGIAVFLAVAAIQLAWLPGTPHGWLLLTGSTLSFAIGLVDDLLHIKLYQKLSGQVMAAALVVSCGLTLPWAGWAPLNIAIAADPSSRGETTPPWQLLLMMA